MSSQVYRLEFEQARKFVVNEVNVPEFQNLHQKLELSPEFARSKLLALGIPIQEELNEFFAGKEVCLHEPFDHTRKMNQAESTPGGTTTSP